jgi:hypothetical protein
VAVLQSGCEQQESATVPPAGSYAGRCPPVTRTRAQFAPGRESEGTQAACEAGPQYFLTRISQPGNSALSCSSLPPNASIAFTASRCSRALLTTMPSQTANAVKRMKRVRRLKVRFRRGVILRILGRKRRLIIESPCSRARRLPIAAEYLHQ